MGWVAILLLPHLLPAEHWRRREEALEPPPAFSVCLWDFAGGFTVTRPRNIRKAGAPAKGSVSKWPPDEHKVDVCGGTDGT